MYVQSGTTVKLTGRFYDWEDNPTDPDNVTVTIFDKGDKEIDKLTPINKDVGEWYVLYTVPVTGQYTFEFKGIIDGYPYLSRKNFIAKFG